MVVEARWWSRRRRPVTMVANGKTMVTGRTACHRECIRDGRALCDEHVGKPRWRDTLTKIATVEYRISKKDRFVKHNSLQWQICKDNRKNDK